MWKHIAGCMLVLGLWSQPADACGVLREKHAIDPSERKVDTQPPAQIVAKVTKISRGQGPRLRDQGIGPSSCDDVGFVEIELTRFEDDRTPPDLLGYRIGPAIGVLPNSPPAHSTDVYRLIRGQKPVVVLVWIDHGSDEQEPFDFTVSLTAVDRAGNESVASAPVRIAHPGRKADQ